MSAAGFVFSPAALCRRGGRFGVRGGGTDTVRHGLDPVADAGGVISVAELWQAGPVDDGAGLRVGVAAEIARDLEPQVAVIGKRHKQAAMPAGHVAEAPSRHQPAGMDPGT